MRWYVDYSAQPVATVGHALQRAIAFGLVVDERAEWRDANPPVPLRVSYFGNCRTAWHASSCEHSAAMYWGAALVP